MKSASLFSCLESFLSFTSLMQLLWTNENNTKQCFLLALDYWWEEVAPRTGRALSWLASKQEHVRRLLPVPPQWGRTIGGPGICCKSSYFWTFWVELWMKCFIGFAKVLFEALILTQNFWDWCLCQDALIYIDISDLVNHVLSWAKTSVKRLSTFEVVPGQGLSWGHSLILLIM